MIALSNPALPGVTLTYTKLQQITDDIDDGRVYGGIHFRFDQEAGAVLGRRVGRFVMRHNLRSRPSEDGDDDGGEADEIVTPDLSNSTVKPKAHRAPAIEYKRALLQSPVTIDSGR